MKKTLCVLTATLFLSMGTDSGAKVRVPVPWTPPEIDYKKLQMILDPESDPWYGKRDAGNVLRNRRV